MSLPLNVVLARSKSSWIGVPFALLRVSKAIVSPGFSSKAGTFL